MSYQKCLGGCGHKIGSGCGCCSPDFPEEYGYCRECYPKSSGYAQHMQVLNGLLDRLDQQGTQQLLTFLKEYASDHENLYIALVAARTVK